jgi:hypothetical protein
MGSVQSSSHAKDSPPASQISPAVSFTFSSPQSTNEQSSSHVAVSTLSSQSSPPSTMPLPQMPVGPSLLLLSLGVVLLSLLLLLSSTLVVLVLSAIVVVPSLVLVHASPHVVSAFVLDSIDDGPEPVSGPPLDSVSLPVPDESPVPLAVSFEQEHNPRVQTPTIHVDQRHMPQGSHETGLRSRGDGHRHPDARQNQRGVAEFVDLQMGGDRVRVRARQQIGGRERAQ